MPQPAYRLDDGTDMVPLDYFAPLDEAASVAALPAWFAERYGAAAQAWRLPCGREDVEVQWQSHLGGGYLVCLRTATPEAIAEKAHHVTALEALPAAPRPDDTGWLRALRRSVDGLAAIERPGAALDPPRWGGPMSPQWFGSHLRTQYPLAFGGPAGRAADHVGTSGSAAAAPRP